MLDSIATVRVFVAALQAVVSSLRSVAATFRANAASTLAAAQCSRKYRSAGSSFFLFYTTKTSRSVHWKIF